LKNGLLISSDVRIKRKDGGRTDSELVFSTMVGIHILHAQPRLLPEFGVIEKLLV
jgi:hypothetical protein